MEALYHVRAVMSITQEPPSELSFAVRFERLQAEHVPIMARMVADALFRAYCQSSARSTRFAAPGCLSVSVNSGSATFTLELIGEKPVKEGNNDEG
mgnify:FL=1